LVDFPAFARIDAPLGDVRLLALVEFLQAIVEELREIARWGLFHGRASKKAPRSVAFTMSQLTIVLFKARQ
jgi:hypothetical protein